MESTGFSVPPLVMNSSQVRALGLDQNTPVAGRDRTMSVGFTETYDSPQATPRGGRPDIFKRSNQLRQRVPDSPAANRIGDDSVAISTASATPGFGIPLSLNKKEVVRPTPGYVPVWIPKNHVYAVVHIFRTHKAHNIYIWVEPSTSTDEEARVRGVYAYLRYYIDDNQHPQGTRGPYYDGDHRLPSFRKVQDTDALFPVDERATGSWGKFALESLTGFTFGIWENNRYLYDIDKAVVSQILFEDWASGDPRIFYLEFLSAQNNELWFRFLRQWMSSCGMDLQEHALAHWIRIWRADAVRNAVELGAYVTMYDEHHKLDIWLTHDGGRIRTCAVDQSLHMTEIHAIEELPPSPEHPYPTVVLKTEEVTHFFSHASAHVLSCWTDALYTEHAKEGPEALHAAQGRMSALVSREISGSYTGFPALGSTTCLLPGPVTVYDSPAVTALKRARASLAPLVQRSVSHMIEGVLLRVHTPASPPLMLRFQVRMGRLTWSTPSERNPAITDRNSIPLPMLTAVWMGRQTTSFALCSSAKDLPSAQCFTVGFMPALLDVLAPFSTFVAAVGVTGAIATQALQYHTASKLRAPGELCLEAESAEAAQAFVLYLRTLAAEAPVVRRSRALVSRVHTKDFQQLLSPLLAGEDLMWRCSAHPDRPAIVRRVLYRSGRLFLCAPDSGIALASLRAITHGIHAPFQRSIHNKNLDPLRCWSFMYDAAHNAQIIANDLVGLDSLNPENNPNSPYCPAYKNPLVGTQALNVEFRRREQLVLWHEGMRALLLDSGMVVDNRVPGVERRIGPIYIITPRTEASLVQDALSGRIFVVYGGDVDGAVKQASGIVGALHDGSSAREDDEAGVMAEYEGYTSTWCELGQVSAEGEEENSAASLDLMVDGEDELVDPEAHGQGGVRSLVFATSAGISWAPPHLTIPLRHVESAWVGDQRPEEEGAVNMTGREERALEQAELRKLNKLMSGHDGAENETMLGMRERLTVNVEEQVIENGELTTRLKTMRLYYAEPLRASNKNKLVSAAEEVEEKVEEEEKEPEDERMVAVDEAFAADEGDGGPDLHSPMAIEGGFSINDATAPISDPALRGPVSEWARAVLDHKVRYTALEARARKNKHKALVKAGKRWARYVDDQRFAALLRGVMVTVHSHEEAPRERLVYWSQGRVCVEEPTKVTREAGENSYAVDSVDILLGKQTRGFLSSKWGPKANELCCFTLLVRDDYDADVEINIEMSSELHMQHYVDTLEAFFTEEGFRTVRSEEKAAHPAIPTSRFVSFLKPDSFICARGSVRQLQADMVREGAPFYYFPSPHAPPQLVTLLIRGGSVVLVPRSQVVPAHAIQQTVLTLTHDLAQRGVGARLGTVNEAATIMYESFTHRHGDDDDDTTDGVKEFVISAPGHLTRLHSWFMSLQICMRHAGLVVAPEMQAIGGILGYRQWSFAQPLEKHATISGRGHVLRLHPYLETVNFTADASRLYFCDARPGQQHTHARSIYLRDILMIQCGLASYAFANVDKESQGLDVRTFSITLSDPYGREEEVGVECDSRSQFLRVLETILAQTRALDLHVQQTHSHFIPGSQLFLWSSRHVHGERAFDLAPPKVAHVHAAKLAARSLLTPALRVLMRGSPFTGLAISREGRVQKAPIHLFFSHATHATEQDQGDKYIRGQGDGTALAGGRLWWCPAGQRQYFPSCSVALEDITDVYIGKHTPVLRSLASSDLDPRCCVSLLTADDTIDLCASDPAVVRQWCTALCMVLHARRHAYALQLPTQGLVVSADNLIDSRALAPYVNAVRARARRGLIEMENDASVQQQAIHVPGSLSALARALAVHLQTKLAFAPVTAAHYLSLQSALAASLERAHGQMTAEHGVEGFILTLVHAPATSDPAGEHVGDAALTYVDPFSEEHAVDGDAVSDLYLDALRNKSCLREPVVLFYSSPDEAHPGSLYWCLPPPAPRMALPLQTIPLNSIVSLSVCVKGPTLAITSPVLRGVAMQDTLVLQTGRADELMSFAKALSALHRRHVSRSAAARAVEVSRHMDEVVRDVTASTTALGLALAEAGRGDAWDPEEDAMRALTEGAQPGEKEFGFPIEGEGGHMLTQPQVLAVSVFDPPLDSVFDVVTEVSGAETGTDVLASLLSGLQLTEFPYVDTVALTTDTSTGKGGRSSRMGPTATDSGALGDDALLLMSADEDEREARMVQALDAEKKARWAKAQEKMEKQRQRALETKRAEAEEARRVMEEIAAHEAAIAAAMEVEVEYVYEEEEEEEEEVDILSVKPAAEILPEEIDDRVRPPSIWEIIAARATEAKAKLAQTEVEIAAAISDSDEEESPTAAVAAEGEGDSEEAKPVRRTKHEIWQSSLQDAAVEEKILEELLIKAREARVRAEEKMRLEEEKKEKKKKEKQDTNAGEEGYAEVASAPVMEDYETGSPVFVPVSLPMPTVEQADVDDEDYEDEDQQ